MSIAVIGLCVSRAAAQTAVSTPTPRRDILRGDRIFIKVAEAPDISREFSVAGDGTIDVPLIGRIMVESLTTEEVAAKVEEALDKQYFKHATVTAEISQAVEGNILVLGAVDKPGIIPFSGSQIMTLVEALIQAGGMSGAAAGHEVRILRWKPGGGTERQILTVDVQGMMESLDFSKDQYLRPRDIIFVPSLGGLQGQSEFLALGEVGSPGFHACSSGLDIIRAVGLFGGIGHGAKMDAARILRPQPSGGFKVIPVDLSRLFGAADVSVNVAILPGDIFFVPSSEQSAGGKIYLLGQVAQPGALAISMDQQTTLARVILSIGGATKFGNTSKVKILRTAPDGTRQTLVVDVESILKTGDFAKDVPLRNEDVVIVPEKLFGL